MPKIKTHKATSKRFRVTGTGKIRRTRLGKSHLRRRKSARAKAEFGELKTVTNKAMARRVRRLAPYLKKK
ncbi:MAG TPA: bL35 family ribosomal protein [Anaerolineae bacterium]|nr:bL35 family ribosomal protein [Anaerolineae bacterium]